MSPFETDSLLKYLKIVFSYTHLTTSCSTELEGVENEASKYNMYKKIENPEEFILFFPSVNDEYHFKIHIHQNTIRRFHDNRRNDVVKNLVSQNLDD